MPKPTAQTSDEQSASGDLPASRELSVSSGLQDTLRWATGRLREIYGSRLKHLILFGSQARGDAGLLLENGTAESTINRAYCAAFQAPRAALQTEGESPETHSGVIRRFVETIGKQVLSGQ